MYMKYTNNSEFIQNVIELEQNPTNMWPPLSAFYSYLYMIRVLGTVSVNVIHKLFTPVLRTLLAMVCVIFAPLPDN